MNLKHRKTTLLGVLFISTLVIVAGLLKMLTNEWPLVLTTLGGFISLGVAFWASYVSRETNERWKRKIALAAAIGGLMSIGSGVLAHFQQLTKDREQRQQTIQNGQLLRDSKEISEDNRQLSKENKQLAEENRGLSQENRKLLRQLNEQSAEMALYLSGGDSIGFLEFVSVGLNRYALMLRHQGTYPVQDLTFQMRQIPLVESQSPVTLQLPVLTPQMKKQWANFRLPDGNVANYLVTIDSRNRSLVQRFNSDLVQDGKRQANSMTEILVARFSNTWIQAMRSMGTFNSNGSTLSIIFVIPSIQNHNNLTADYGVLLRAFRDRQPESK